MYVNDNTYFQDGYVNEKKVFIEIVLNLYI